MSMQRPRPARDHDDDVSGHMYVEETVDDDVTGHTASDANIRQSDSDDDVEGHQIMPQGPIGGPGNVDR